jgi:hypothetical protein
MRIASDTSDASKNTEQEKTLTSGNDTLAKKHGSKAP